MAPDEDETTADRSAARSAARAGERAAEGLATGLEEQRLRVEEAARAVSTAAAGETVMATVLAEIDIAHEELRVAEEALRAQQRRLDDLLAERSDPRAWHRGLVHAVPVPALVTDPGGTVLELNDAASALLGRSPDELVQRPFADLVVDGDGRQVEQVLRLLDDGPDTRTLTVSLRGPVGAPVEVELVVGADVPTPAGPLLTWVASNVLPADADAATGLRTAEAFAEMCRLPLAPDADTRSVLASAALLVEKAIPTSDGVSITLGPPDDPETQATDNVWAQEVDGAQVRAGEGPCLQAYSTGSVTVTEDLRLDPRWPRLAQLVVPVGVASVLGCPIRTDSHSLGVLNVYSRRSGAFDQRDERVAQLLVSAVLAVVQETRDRNELTQLSRQLREALESRAIIDQAKGILMSRNRLGPDQAFAQLVASSRRSNRKVRDVARTVVEDATRGATDGGATRGATDGGAARSRPHRPGRVDGGPGPTAAAP